MKNKFTFMLFVSLSLVLTGRLYAADMNMDMSSMDMSNMEEQKADDKNADQVFDTVVTPENAEVPAIPEVFPAVEPQSADAQAPLNAEAESEAAVKESAVAPVKEEAASVAEKVEDKAEEKVEEKKEEVKAVVPASSTGSPSVDIVSTADGKTVYSKLKITENSDGVLVEGKFTGVPNPGKHGLHVHENGSCADKGAAAGGHFNPDNREHGSLAHSGHAGAHAGDMGNVDIDEKGNGTFSFLLKASSLKEGRYNIAGKSIVLHEKEDDFTPPTGNSGGRIGCGVIPQ